MCLALVSDNHHFYRSERKDTKSQRRFYKRSPWTWGTEGKIVEMAPPTGTASVSQTFLNDWHNWPPPLLQTLDYPQASTMTHLCQSGVPDPVIKRLLNPESNQTPLLLTNITPCRSPQSSTAIYTTWLRIFNPDLDWTNARILQNWFQRHPNHK